MADNLMSGIFHFRPTTLNFLRVYLMNEMQATTWGLTIRDRNANFMPSRFIIAQQFSSKSLDDFLSPTFLNLFNNSF